MSPDTSSAYTITAGDIFELSADNVVYSKGVDLFVGDFLYLFRGDLNLYSYEMVKDKILVNTVAEFIVRGIEYKSWFHYLFRKLIKNCIKSVEVEVFYIRRKDND